MFKNWLKHIFVVTAYVWEAALCSTLPIADENAATDSSVTTVSSSFQPQFLRRMRNFEATGVANFVSGRCLPFLSCTIDFDEIFANAG